MVSPHVNAAVRLTVDVPESRLHRGDEGVVVGVWLSPGDLLFQVEFPRSADDPVGPVLLRVEQLEVVGPRAPKPVAQKEQQIQHESDNSTTTSVCANQNPEHSANGIHDSDSDRQATVTHIAHHEQGSPNPHAGRPRVLVAEDDDEMRQVLVRALAVHGYAPVECRDGFDLFAHLEAFVGRHATLEFEAIISDILMPGPTGLEILEALHDHAGFPPMILITAYGDNRTHARARKAGAAAILDKPFGIDELMAKLREIVPS